MAIPKRLLNQRGQILIEAIFLALLMSGVLVLFKQLIDYQRSRQGYRFTKPTKEHSNVLKPPIHIPK